MVVIEEIIEEQEESNNKTDQQDKEDNTVPDNDSPASPGGDEWVHVKHDDAPAEESNATGDLEANKLQESTAEQSEPTEAAEGNLDRAEGLKQDGNDLFRAGDYQKAIEKYSEAIEEAPSSAEEQAVYLGNRAACYLKLEQLEEVIEDCSAALEIKPDYTKVLLRRAATFEALDDLEHAFTDAQKVKELEPGNAEAAAMIKKIEPIVNERREKMKDEMMGKLKELGNMVLGKFGMSLDNFKAEQDPQTGAYSIKMQQ